jgi:uncharacterized membrane protein
MGHFRHHARFYVSALLGLLVGLALEARGSPISLVAAGDVFFVAYLISAGYVARRATPSGLRKYAAYDDEGVRLIFLLTFAAIAVSLTAIFMLLRQKVAPDAGHLLVTLASVPLGWFTLHTLLGFRYAHLYYAPDVDGDARGLDFHGTEEPAAYDFLYHAFVIGMTGGVSDVEVKSTPMRRLATVHGIVSFFFNTVIVALTVSIVASLASG